MSVPVFYTAALDAPRQGKTSPSAAKPGLAVSSWLDKEYAIEVTPFVATPMPLLAKVHDARYLTGVLSLREPNGFGTHDELVARSVLHTTGSFRAAAAHAYETGKAACSPTSGFHHAAWGSGGGYCTFNGLAVAAAHLLRESGAQIVGIMDLDAHYGDGTEDILDQVPLFSERIRHFTRGVPSYRDDAEELLASIPKTLKSWERQGVDMVLYQAGGDLHIEDPLGAGLLTSKQMRERDRRVFETCAELGLPVAWNLAGGYQEDKSATPLAKRLRPVLDIHDATMEECIRVFGSN